MLDPVIVIPEAQIEFENDVNNYIQKELYGIDKCPKPFSHILASLVIQTVLNGTTISTAQQQCLLGVLQSI